MKAIMKLNRKSAFGKDEAQRKAENFFKMLINKTGTYFLSDYVEEVKDYDNVAKYEARDIVKKRDELKELCEKHGLDIHWISQVVAQEFLDIIDPSLSK